MQVNPDFRDLLVALNDAGAEYLLVGGHAVAFHAEPRFTKDFDVWVRATPENARRVMAALTAFGAPLRGVAPRDFATPDMVFMIGVPPNRIDVITAIDGVTFDEAWPNRVPARYGEATVSIIGRDDLIRNKTTSGRPQDLVDVDVLRRAGT
jgi:hypothetical protein